MKIKRMQIKRASRSKYIFLFGLIVALAASVLVVQAIKNYEQLVQVVVASGDIEPFTVLRDSHLKTVSVPKNTVQRNALYTSEDLGSSKTSPVGKATRSFIAAGTPISRSAIADTKGNPELLSAKVTELKNSKLGAFAVPMDSIAALGGQISPGDKVHVIGALNIPVGISKTAKEPVAKIIAPYAKVIQVLKNGDNTSGVILALTPQQAQDIQLALLNGRVSLMLLPYEPDLNVGYTETTTVQSFIKKYIEVGSSLN